VLLPGERRKAKAINVLLPGNAGGGNKRNIAIRTKVTKKYYHRGNVVGRKL